jgi:hypothetical protein
MLLFVVLEATVGYRLLLVDDPAGVPLKPLAQFLRRKGHKVTCASAGNESFRLKKVGPT